MAKKQDPEDYAAIKDLMQEQLLALEKQEEKVGAINKLFTLSKFNLVGVQDLQEGIVENLSNAKDTVAEQKEIEKSVIKILNTKTGILDHQKKSLLEALDQRKGELDLQEKVNKLLKDQQDLTHALADSTDGFIDSIETKVKNIPFLGDFLAKSMGFDKLRTQFKDDVISSFGDGLKGMTTSVKGFGKSLLTSLAPLAPLLITLTLIKLAFDFDKEVTELSRNLGISRDAAVDMSASFNKMALTSGDLSVTSKELVKAQTELSEATGMSAMFSEDMLTTQIKLVKFMGMSGEQAAKLNVYSKSIGMETRDLQLEVVGVVHQFNEATGASVNLNDVLKDISDLSVDLRANFKGNVEEMTKAVTLARSMGISLKESVSAAESTLSISSSIKKEMTAMMLTGVSINNNAIRRAQLEGKPEEVLRLQKEQLMEMGDLAKKTPMQRKAIADAMGFEVNKLMEMNEHAKFQKEMNVDISKATVDQINNSTSLSKEKKKELIAQKEQLSMQQKMNVLTTKLGEIFQSLAPSLLAIAEIFGSIIGFIGTAIESLGGLKFILKSIATLYVIKAAMAVYGSLALIPFIGPVIGAAASAATLAGGLGLIASVGDVMSPADGKTQVSTKEGGLYELSPNDDLAAAPGLLSGGGGGIDLSGLINEIKGLRSSLINEIKGLRGDIQTQPIQVTVDGRVVSEISRVQKQQNSVSTTGYGR